MSSAWSLGVSKVVDVLGCQASEGFVCLAILPHTFCSSHGVLDILGKLVWIVSREKLSFIEAGVYFRHSYLITAWIHGVSEVIWKSYRSKKGLQWLDPCLFGFHYQRMG